MKKALAFICMFTLAGSAYATDIVGIITDRTDRGAQGATVTVSCGEFEKTVTTAMSGDYRITGVPEGSTCSLSIKFRDVSSEPYAFSTTSERMTFSRRVQRYKDKLEFL